MPCPEQYRPTGTVCFAEVHPFTAARTPAAPIIATLRQQISSIPVAPRT